MYTKQGKLDKTLTFDIPLAMMLLWTLFPIYWTLNTALKPEGDIIQTPLQYLPSSPTFQNFINAWNDVGFEKYFTNSVVVGVGTVILTLVLSVLAGYALARYEFKGKRVFMLILLMTQFIPRSMLIIPLFVMFSNVGMISNPISLMLVYSAVQIPFSAILMSGFISGIPPELEEEQPPLTARQECRPFVRLSCFITIAWGCSNRDKYFCLCLERVLISVNAHECTKQVYFTSRLKLYDG